MKYRYKFGVLLASFLTLSTSYAWKEITVTKGDSLTLLAQKYHLQGVSRMDMIIAIRNANPHVFTTKASNFKAGIKLSMPSSVNDVRAAIKGKSSPPATKTSPKPELKPVPIKLPADKPAANNKTINPKPVKAPKTNATTNNMLSVTATTIKSLQNTVSNQTETIQSYQNQLNQLNGQLNIANQQVQSLERQPTEKIWTLGNLWLVLWLVTLAAFFVQYIKYRNLLKQEPYYDENDDEELLSQEIDEEPQISESEADDPIPLDKQILDEEHIEEEAIEAEDDDLLEPLELPINDLRQEPHLTTSEIDINEEEAPAPRAISENWEQVELDIPVTEPPPEMEIPELRDLDKFEHKEAAIGEQQDIIDVLAQDEDNMEWHQALLEFYVKTNSQNGFKRHYQTMLKSGLMVEGDALWEDIRKMYLNKWIYQTI